MMRRLGDHPTMEELRVMVAEVDQVEDIMYLEICPSKEVACKK